MKKIISSLLVLSFTITLFSQTPVAGFSKDYYLKKYKSQKGVGWILLGGGVGMLVLSAAAYDDSGCYVCQAHQPDNTLSDVLGYTGLTATLVSIPFFISAHHNKKKAASVTINNENIILPITGSFVIKKQPTFGLKISL